MGEGDEDAKLKKATLSSLDAAEKHNLKSIAFPAISTGIFGYPLEAATEIAVETVREHQPRHLSLVRFVCFDEGTLAAYQARLADDPQLG